MKAKLYHHQISWVFDLALEHLRDLDDRNEDVIAVKEIWLSWNELASKLIAQGVLKKKRGAK